MDELAALLGDGLFDGGVRVAEGVDADAAEEIEVACAVFVAEIHAFAARRRDRDCDRMFRAEVSLGSFYSPVSWSSQWGAATWP